MGLLRRQTHRATSIDLEQAFMDPKFLKYLGKDNVPLKRRYIPAPNKYQQEQKEKNVRTIASVLRAESNDGSTSKDDGVR